jgi:pyruvate,orthophosphate dikinase
MRSEYHLTLHGLAVKKYASASSVADATGTDALRVAAILDECVTRGWVVAAAGKYSLAPIGRTLLGNEYSRFYADVRKIPEFVAAYNEFDAINGSLKTLITNWQMIEIAGTAMANDHSNEDYDQKIIDRLGEFHEHADRVLAMLAKQVPRFQVYRDKLKVALERAEDGDIQWVSDVKIDSYHTLWFELHEDLLCTLGRTRAE